MPSGAGVLKFFGREFANPAFAVAVFAALALVVGRPPAVQAAVARNQQADTSRSQPARPPAEAFVDAAARDLYDAATAQWRRLDESIGSYAARVQQRLAAAVRLPLKDRTVYASETALRVFWRRNKHPIVQVLGMRSRDPTGTVQPAEDRGWLNDLPFSRPFDPGADIAQHAEYDIDLADVGHIQNAAGLGRQQGRHQLFADGVLRGPGAYAADQRSAAADAVHPAGILEHVTRHLPRRF